MKFFYMVMTFFYNNLGIRAVIIYFCFVLIDLIIMTTTIFIFRNNVYETAFYENLYFKDYF